MNQGEIEVLDEILTRFEEAATSSLQSNGFHAYPKSFMEIIGPVPFQCPPGFKWIPSWEMAPTNSSCSRIGHTQKTLSPNVQNKSFGDVFLDKIKPLQKEPNNKRRKVNLSAAIISDKDLLEQMKIDEEENENKKKKRKRKRHPDITYQTNKSISTKQMSMSITKCIYQGMKQMTTNQFLLFQNVQKLH